MQEVQPAERRCSHLQLMLCIAGNDFIACLMCPDSTGLPVHEQFSCFLEILDSLHKQQLLVKLQAQRTRVKSRDAQGGGGVGLGYLAPP